MGSGQRSAVTVGSERERAMEYVVVSSVVHAKMTCKAFVINGFVYFPKYTK